MLQYVDRILNRVTMYRLVLYYLVFLLALAILFCFVGWLPYDPLGLIVSTLALLAICWAANTLCARVFAAPTNVESLYITALILALIITPPQVAQFSASVPFLFWAAVWAMASKYIFTIAKKHIFNPAAFAVALTAISINHSASWWVGGNLPLLIFVLVGGLLVTRKIARFDLVLSFFLAALATIVGPSLLGGGAVATAGKALLHAPILFFAFILLTEPLTTPPTRRMRIYYGAFVGFLFAPFIHIGAIYSTPELALLCGNVFSYIVSPKEKLLLKLKERTVVGADIYDFLFTADRRLAFRPGQYLEWTLGHARTDSRGNRRYFTVASSPTEEGIRLGVKVYPQGSSFKNSLLSLGPDDEIVASQLAGEFVLPKDPTQKLVLIAGGIGITPFRSMIQYCLDRGEKRPIILLYSNKISSEICYKDIFDRAEQQLGMKVVYTLTDLAKILPSWRGRRGAINGSMIQAEVPDYKERMFYISGPHGMVTAFKDVLAGLGIKKSRIKTDFFPGFA